MKTCTVLPERYEAAASVDLQNDKRKALLVNGLSAAVMLLMILLGHFLIRPVTDLFGFDDTNSGWFLRIAVMMAGLFVYVILHELAHAAAMKSFGAKQVRFGFTGLYAFAGSEADYFGKTAYLWISTVPLIVFGILFTVLMIVGPSDWFWVFYFWQIANVSGSAGDLYVFFRTAALPDTVLIRDTGTSMRFYLPAGEAETASGASDGSA